MTRNRNRFISKAVLMNGTGPFGNRSSNNQRAARRIGAHMLILICAALFPAACASITATESWFGNSGYQQSDHILQNPQSMYVTPNGSVASISFWDEAGSNVQVLKTDGSLQCVPDQSGTGSWGRMSNGAVTCDPDFVYQAMSQNASASQGGTNSVGGARYPQSGVTWQCVRRYSLSNGSTASFSNGNGYCGSMLTVSSNTLNDQTGHAVAGIVVCNSELFVADEDSKSIKVYQLQLQSQSIKRSWQTSEVGQLGADAGGNIWMLQQSAKMLVRYSSSGVPQPQSIVFAADVVPTNFCVDRRTDKIYVTNNGIAQNILIYSNISSSPQLNSTFGVTRGVFEGTGPTIGTVGPQRFCGPTGVGIDSSGNVYVQCSFNFNGGASIEKYTPAGVRQWARYCTVFESNGAIDNGSDTDAFSVGFHYKLDYSKRAPGSEWEVRGFLKNPFKYPNQKIGLSDVWVRTVLGKRLHYSIDQMGGDLAITRFNPQTDGECGIPSGVLGSATLWRDVNGDGLQQTGEIANLGQAWKGWGYYVDTRANIWLCNPDSGGTIRVFPLDGFDDKGNPMYSLASRKISVVRTLFTELCRAIYMPETDIMYLSGFTTAHPRDPADGLWGGGAENGGELMRIPSWSTGNRTPSWRTVIPYGGSAHKDIFCKGIAAAGDYVFVVECKNNQKVHVYSESTGLEVAILEHTPAKNSWTDISQGINAHRRANGEYIVTIIGQWVNNVTMFRFTDGTVTKLRGSGRSSSGRTDPAVRCGRTANGVFVNVDATDPHWAELFSIDGAVIARGSGAGRIALNPVGTHVPGGTYVIRLTNVISGAVQCVRARIRTE